MELSAVVMGKICVVVVGNARCLGAQDGQSNQRSYSVGQPRLEGRNHPTVVHTAVEMSDTH